MRIGHGYDVHRLVPGRELILGGGKIPYELGLDGHSDADVLLHAVMDALLGAAALVVGVGGEEVELLDGGGGVVDAVIAEHPVGGDGMPVEVDGMEVGAHFGVPF